MTATTAKTPEATHPDRTPAKRLGERVRHALAAAEGQMAGLTAGDQVRFLSQLAADLAAASARVFRDHSATPRRPDAPVPANAPPGTLVELRVAGDFPVDTGGRFRLDAGEVLTLARPLSDGRGDLMRAVTSDDLVVEVPHADLRLHAVFRSARPAG